MVKNLESNHAMWVKMIDEEAQQSDDNNDTPSDANPSSVTYWCRAISPISTHFSVARSVCQSVCHIRVSTDLGVIWQVHTSWTIKKRGTILLSDFKSFFHWHTLWTVFNNVIIICPTTPEMRLYTILWNINVRKLNNNNKHLSKWKNTSGQHCSEWSVWHTDHSPQCWSELFFFNLTKMFVCYYCYACTFHSYFTR